MRKGFFQGLKLFRFVVRLSLLKGIFLGRYRFANGQGEG